MILVSVEAPAKDAILCPEPRLLKFTLSTLGAGGIGGLSPWLKPRGWGFRLGKP